MLDPVSTRAARRRDAYRRVRRSLESDALLAAGGERLAQAVEEFLVGGERAQLDAAFQAYLRAAVQASGPTST